MSQERIWTTRGVWKIKKRELPNVNTKWGSSPTRFATFSIGFWRRCLSSQLADQRGKPKKWLHRRCLTRKANWLRIQWSLSGICSYSRLRTRERAAKRPDFQEIPLEETWECVYFLAPTTSANEQERDRESDFGPSQTEPAAVSRGAPRLIGRCEMLFGRRESCNSADVLSKSIGFSGSSWRTGRSGSWVVESSKILYLRLDQLQYPDARFKSIILCATGHLAFDKDKIVWKESSPHRCSHGF